MKGIEPSYSAWKAAALPLSYTRIRSFAILTSTTLTSTTLFRIPSTLRHKTQKPHT